WESVSSEDELLDRILLVHRYLEGSGLDASESILRRLSGVIDNGIREIVNVIYEEEIDHVSFGSRWYQTFCRNEGLDPSDDFEVRLKKLAKRIPRRLEKLNYSAR